MNDVAGGEVFAEAIGIAAFAAVVQLGSQRRAELPGQLGQVVLLAEWRALARQRCQFGQDRQIRRDSLLDVGALDFDDHLCAVVQHSSVNLPE